MQYWCTPNQSWLSSTLRRWLLCDERPVQFFLFKRKSWTDHDGPTFSEVFDELRNERSPCAPGITTKSEEQLEGRHRVWITFDGPDLATFLLRLEVNVKCTASVNMRKTRWTTSFKTVSNCNLRNWDKAN